MNTADIRHQHAVNEDPYVVVAAEPEGHGILRAHVGELAASGLLEGDLHGKTQIVVEERIIGAVGTVGHKDTIIHNRHTTLIGLEHLCRLIEGEELAVDRISALHRP